MTYGSRITEINPLSPCSNLSHSFWIILYIVCICSLRIVHSHEPKRNKVAAANEKKSQIKRIELVAECHFDWYVNVCWLQWKQNARIARIMKIRQQKPKQLIKNSTTYKYKDSSSNWSSMSKRLTSKSWVFIRVNYLVASDLVVHQNWLFFSFKQWTPWDEHICFQQNTLAANVNAENKSPEWVWKSREIK